jgi:hypothetical protein
VRELPILKNQDKAQEFELGLCVWLSDSTYLGYKAMGMMPSATGKKRKKERERERK